MVFEIENLNVDNYVDFLKVVYPENKNYKKVYELKKNFVFDLDKKCLPIFATTVSPEEILSKIISCLKDPNSTTKNDDFIYIYDFPWYELMNNFNNLKRKKSVYLTQKFGCSLEIWFQNLEMNFKVIDCSVDLINFPINVIFYSILMILISHVVSCIPNKLHYYIDYAFIESKKFNLKDLNTKPYKQTPVLRVNRFVDDLMDFCLKDVEIYDYIPKIKKSTQFDLLKV